MKEQDLRRCFSKIKPSERLVNDTIRKIGEAEESRSTRPAFRFSGRLASAMCALVVVLGLSVAVLYNPTMIPKSPESEGAAEMALASGRTVIQDTAAEPTVSHDANVLTRMASDAEKAGGEYAVFFGSLDGCYFGDVTEEDAERGVIYHCTLTFTVGAASEESFAAAGDALQADVYVCDADTMDAITNSTAGYVYVRLTRDGGEWVVEELIPHVEE